MNLPIAFGKYLLIERIATGGMAEVFKAKAFGIAGFEKIVAIKRIHPHLSLDQEFVNMFIDEARIASALTHPGIVQIFDLGKIDDTYFIAMEYVDGITLEKYIHSDVEQSEKLMLSCYIIKEISSALHYAHTKKSPDGTPMNIVHRDISPQNVLLSEDGMVKLTDFGVAKARLRISRTEPGMTKGKYPYMSPEQVLGKQVDHRSDIFSLSVLFYELLTGKLAFDGDTEFEIMESIKKCEYQLPRKLNRFIPEEKIVIKGIQKNPFQRFNSAEELALCLSEFLSKNKFMEPQNSLKKIVNKIKGTIDETKDRTDISTIVLRQKKNRGIKKLFIPIITVIIITLSLIIVYQSQEKRTDKARETKTSIENNYSERHEQLNEVIEKNKPATTIEERNEQKALVAKVNINTVPWSYVYIDGKKIGETPLSGIVLKPGEHQFTFENPDLNLHITRTIRAEAGEEKTILENLRK